MNFKEAFKLMKQGKKAKLPSWGGYWYWDEEKQTVMMHCKDGRVLDIRETEVVEYTLGNVCSDEWILADATNTPVLGGVATFNFGEAIKYLKRGFKVKRQGWNGKEQFLFLVKGETLEYETSANLDCLVGKEIHHPDVIAIKTTKGDIQVGWLASQTDMLAEDWIFAE